MPSPVGHALGGFIAGWLVAGGPSADAAPSREPLGRALLRAAAFAGAGMAADLDLLVNQHSQFTHSLGAVGVVLAVAALVLHGRRRWLLLALAIAAAYASHPLLDWLAEDATPPRGITALWPISREYFLSHADIFRGISRQPWKPGVLRHDALAIVREIVLLAPLAVGAWALGRRRKWQEVLQKLHATAGNAGQQLQSAGRPGATGESNDV